MSFTAYDAIKERIRESIDIVELVGRYVPLQRRGAIYYGRCPWHDDSRPSLQVNPQRQSFRCYVCNIGGDIFAFIMKIENVTFREALEILAERAGIAIPKKNDFIRIGHGGVADPQHSNAFDGDPNALLDEAAGSENESGPTHGERRSQQEHPATDYVRKSVLYQAMQWAAERYQHALLEMDEALPARKYLEKRGITQASIKRFGIGYAPLERDWWIKQLKGDARRIGIFETIGILTRRQDDGSEGADAPPRRANQPYDRFRGRVLFPIRDTQDRTVAFGGRVLPDSPFASRAKYLNSPETPLFSKQRMLYGLDIARLTMGKTRRALIMEGYTDCIMAHQHGFTEAVAVLGTALGPEHVRVLKRFVDKMVLVLDGDKAGVKRANEVLEHFVAQGADMSVLTLPGGEDPCEFLETYGADAFRVLMETEALDALEHAFRSAIQGIDLNNDVVGTTRALDQLLTVIAKAPANLGRLDDQRLIRLEKIVQRIAQRFGMDEARIRQRLGRLRDLAKNDATSLAATPVGPQNGANDYWNDPTLLPDRLEREMIELWLADPTTIYTFWELIPQEWFRSPITRRINRKATELIEQEKLPSFENLLTAFDDPRMKNLLVDLDESGRLKRMARPAPTTDAEGNTIEHEPVEQPYTDEMKDRLIREIVAGFEHRRLDREERLEIGKLRGEELSREEKIDALAALLERQKMKHHKKNESP